MIKKQPKNKIVLVGILKDRRDLNILLRRKWYRIPVRHAPKRKFDYLALYQPVSFGRYGKRIQYYAPVLDYKVIKRSDLLPKELNHPRAKDYYLQVHVGKIEKLSQPIRNIIPRRISFGFTTLNHLLKSKDILQLYKITPTEQMVEDGLKENGIKAIGQYYVSGKKKRYFLDFAIFCHPAKRDLKGRLASHQGKIAIECDNKKAHFSLVQKRKDWLKNAFLKRHGWTMIRLREDDIVSNLKGCIKRVKNTIQKFVKNQS